MALILRSGVRPVVDQLPFCGEAGLKELECLECTVGGKRVLVPTRDLERVAELLLGPPPPLAEPWVGGIALIAGSPVVALVLCASTAYAECKKGLLLRAPRARELYAVIVEDVQAIWTIDEEGFSPADEQAWPCPGGWLTVGERDGEDISRLETDAVAAWLFGAAEQRGLEAGA
jgi:hypothetical protein